MARAILILALLVATAAAARDLMQVEPAVTPATAPLEPKTDGADIAPEATTTTAPEATMAVTTPEAPPMPAEASLAAATASEAPPMPAEASLAAIAQPARGVCYFDASTQNMVFHRGTVLPTTAPAGAQFCIVNLRQPALDTCGAANVIVGADKECTCVNGFALDPHTGVCVATPLASTPVVAASVAVVVNGYMFSPLKDSAAPNGDIVRLASLGPTALATFCNARSDCKGFNTNGYLKKTILPASSWYVWTNDPSKGLYVKSQKCLEVAPTRAGLKAAALNVVNSGKSITWTDSASRWSGISGWKCPPNVPTHSDCSAFVTWLYWMAFGFQPDYLNRQNWAYGWTGTLANMGKVVSSITAAKAGDLVFYGSYPHRHVTMFVGTVGSQTNMVVSFGKTGPAKLYPYNTKFGPYGTDAWNSIRTYPDFGMSDV